MMKLSNNSPFLASTVLMAIIGAYVTADKGGGINLFKASETHMKGPVSFGLIVLLQALFGGQGFTDTPEIMKKLFKHDLMKVVALYLIAFSGTQDIEESLFVIIGFLAFMQLIRTEEERKKHPYLV
tara:strand:+ start:2445 stop:2822 length:378 start_codon:yes stop_codon:yes gene_type:complete